VDDSQYGNVATPPKKKKKNPGSRQLVIGFFWRYNLIYCLVPSWYFWVKKFSG
jgi:hypothetical protein